MPRPAVDPGRRQVLECRSSEVHSVGDLKAFTQTEIGGSCESLVAVALVSANHDRPVRDDTPLTEDFCCRMLTWLHTNTHIIDEVDAAAAGYRKDPRQSAELVVTLQALIQRLGQ